LERAISNAYNKGTSFKIPPTFAHILAKIGDKIGNKSPINTDRLKRIQSELTFSDKKARLELGWNPEPVLNFYK
jgi:nucleoside-diphosphate-sugar epimerase